MATLTDFEPFTLASLTPEAVQEHGEKLTALLRGEESPGSVLVPATWTGRWSVVGITHNSSVLLAVELQSDLFLGTAATARWCYLDFAGNFKQEEDLASITV